MPQLGLQCFLQDSCVKGLVTAHGTVEKWENISEAGPAGCGGAIFIISGPKKLRQEDCHKREVNLGYTMRHRKRKRGGPSGEVQSLGVCP